MDFFFKAGRAAFAWYAAGSGLGWAGFSERSTGGPTDRTARACLGWDLLLVLAL